MIVSFDCLVSFVLDVILGIKFLFIKKTIVLCVLHCPHDITTD